jgi:hypothetical protein
MKKIKIAFAYLAYPFAIASYFRRALERRSDVELWTTGPYTGDAIPWGGGMHIPARYVVPVDLPLPIAATTPMWALVKSQLPWTPDLVLQVDAGFHFCDKPDALTATVATDPHVLNYDLPRFYSDKFFCMQKCYSQPKDIWLPYAHDPTVHYPDPDVQVDTDACLIGLHYQNRNEWVARLRGQGRTVIYDIGIIYDEYRKANCRARLGLNWSSLNDICARVIEIMGMRRVPVINRVPDLEAMGFVENTHYFGFSTMAEAVDRVEYALSHPDEANQFAQAAHEKVSAEDTWDIRVEQILKEFNLI